MITPKKIQNKQKTDCVLSDIVNMANIGVFGKTKNDFFNLTFPTKFNCKRKLKRCLVHCVKGIVGRGMLQ